MKNFILLNDFQAIATTEDLNVLSSDNETIIEQCNKIAIDEAASYLSVKYDIPTLFSSPIVYSSGDTYVIYDRVYVENTGDTVTHYQCIASGATSGTPITDTNYFTEEDSRDNKLLEVVMSISLFYIHKRLSPNNIPVFRVISYDGNGDITIMSAIKWLQMVQDGSLTPYNWPVIEEEGGDPDVDPSYDMLGNNTADGIMWGNDMGEEYFCYNNLHDKNIIISATTSN